MTMEDLSMIEVHVGGCDLFSLREATQFSIWVHENISVGGNERLLRIEQQLSTWKNSSKCIGHFMQQI